METLEGFRKLTKIKMIVMLLATLLPIIILVAFPYITFPDESVKKDLMPYRYVIVGLTETWIIFKIVNYIRVLRNEDVANSLFVKKGDERNKFIKIKANDLALKISLYIYLIILVVMAFVNRETFITLTAVLGVAIFVYIMVYIYYRKKY